MGAGRGKRVGCAVGWVCLLAVLCWGQGGQAPEWFYWFVHHPSPPMVLPIGEPGQLLVGDFNGDGNPDLIIETYRGPLIWELGPDFGPAEVNIVMLLGDGQGGFGPPSTLLTTKGTIDARLVADVNADGWLDLVLVRQHRPADYGYWSEIQVMFGDGSGNLAPPVTLVGVDGLALDVALADVNGNGHLDFLIGHTLGWVVTVFLADGRGGFSHHGSVPVGTDPDQQIERLVLADFNKDGHLDLAVAGMVYDEEDVRWTVTRFVTVFLGDGKGGFPHRSFFMTFDPPEDRVPWINLVTLDYDRDGNMDLITSRQDEILLLLGNGDGTFTLDEGFWLPASDLNPRIDAVVDFNHDGCWDWVISSNSPPWWGLDIIIESCGPFAGSASGRASRLFVSGAVAADVDGDGDLDVVYVSGVMDRHGNELTLLEWVINDITKGEGQ